MLALLVTFLCCSTAMVAAADIVASGNGPGLSLGSRWGPYETYRGASFRWVDNDAEIIVRGARGEVRVAISCEGGPSLGRRSFPLRVLDASGRQVDHVLCAGAGRRAEMLLPASDAPARYVLHVDDGGRRLTGEPRILNFRVFSLDDGRDSAGRGDVVDARSGVRLGDGWGPVERFRGQTFRWLSDNGHIFISSDRPATVRLRLLLEPGPSIGARAAAISVVDPRGAVLFRATVNGRTVVSVPVQLAAGENEVVLRIVSANKHVAGDPRLLNLRLFAANVLR